MRWGRRGIFCGGRGTRFEQLAQRRAGAEEARPNRVERKVDKICDFVVAELLEFAEHQDFAVGWIELSYGTADPEARFSVVVSGGIACGLPLAEKRGAESGFAAIGSQDLQSDGVEISTKKRARFVARCRAH